MTTWRVNEEPPADFLALLYADEEEELPSEPELSDLEDDNSRPPTPEAPPYSPLTSPRLDEAVIISAQGENQLGSGSHHQVSLRESSPLLIFIPDEALRERSPLRVSAPSVVVQIFDEDGAALEFGAGAATEDFLSPDAHAMYVTPGESERGMRGRRGSRRGGRRGGRRGERGRGRSGRARGQLGGRRRASQWEVGHPLNEIWLSDEDVPAELVRMLTNVVRSREERVEEGNERPVRDDESGNEEDDDFMDAEDDPASGVFNWSSMDSFSGREEEFLPERTGAARMFDSAYDAFRSYWDDDIVSLIAYETNRYAEKIASPSFQSEWYATNVHEILCLFAFWMMLGIIKMPTITSCFSTDPLLKTEVFRRIFTLRRYQNLTRALHFIELDPDIPQNDRLFRLRPIISHLNSKFQSNYILDKNICIDESLTLWKGRLDFKQYIRSKASKFGIKSFELCESATGYLWSFIVYTGKQSSLELGQAAGVLKSTAVVKKLIAPLLNKGYRLFMDNWYNSPLLARFLKRNGTDCIGTLRPSRRDVPSIVNKAPLKRGDLIARHSGDMTVLAWQDKKRITMISTCHGSSTALPRVPSCNMSRPIPFKPQVVLDYNKNMGGVDLKDQMLEPYLLERKRCTKWYMKLFKRLVNVSILNSRTLLQSSLEKPQDHLAFRLQLVDSILSNHLPHCPKHRTYSSSSSYHPHQNLARLLPNGHWPVLQYPDADVVERRRRRKYCVVCIREGRKTIRTTYSCEACQVPLCITECFKSYHSS